MRGEERRQADDVVVSWQQRIPEEDALGRVKQLAEAVLNEPSPLFDEMYSAVGRPSIPRSSGC